MLRATLTPSIEIRLQIGQRLGVVVADPTQVHQIVMNLCTNAIHAIYGQGHGVLELLLETCELDHTAAAQFVNLLPGNYLCLSVRDNGHGMNEATLEKIFDPFFSTKEQTEGTGLGLSVIHGIITKLGGAITVASKPGQGTRFDVYLPCREEGTVRSDQVEQNLLRSFGNKRILLIDDDENLLFSVDLLLRQLGYEVVSENKPLRALEVFTNNPNDFDLIITDQAMPEMNGIELASRLAQARPDIPIILCTGYDPTAGYGVAANGEIVDCITELAIKPLERQEMVAVLAKVFNRVPCEGRC